MACLDNGLVSDENRTLFGLYNALKTGGFSKNRVTQRPGVQQMVKKTEADQIFYKKFLENHYFFVR